MTHVERERLCWAVGYVEGLLRNLPWISVLHDVQLWLDAIIRSGEIGLSLRMAGVTGVVKHEGGQEQLLPAWIKAARQTLGWEVAR